MSTGGYQDIGGNNQQCIDMATIVALAANRSCRFLRSIGAS
jgi:hypothetical protein